MHKLCHPRENAGSWEEASSQASRTSKKAHNQCLDIGMVLYKITHYLQQATDQQRNIEVYMEIVADVTYRKRYIEDILEMIAIDWGWISIFFSVLGPFKNVDSIFLLY